MSLYEEDGALQASIPLGTRLEALLGQRIPIVEGEGSRG